MPRMRLQRLQMALAFGAALVLATLPPLRADETRTEEEQESVESFPKLRIIGFSDFDYTSVAQDEGTSSGFFEGAFVLHFTSQLSERFTFFAEMSTTARQDQFRTEVERTIIRYEHSDRLKLSAGRYHTPINYWNVAFHHGAFLQTTVSRPEMIRFGGEFMPVHVVGAQADGYVPAGGLNVNYEFLVGNGRGAPASRPGDAGDVNDSRAVSAHLFARPDHLFGLRVGLSAYTDHFTSTEASVRERIIAAHAVWARESPEVIVEYAHVTHSPENIEADFRSSAWYAQLAYRLPRAASRWKPYARYERLQTPAGDPVFTRVTPVKLLTAGARFDVAEVVALKGEFRRDFAERLYDHALFFQVSFTF